jgi:hypothetical protein
VANPSTSALTTRPETPTRPNRASRNTPAPRRRLSKRRTERERRARPDDGVRLRCARRWQGPSCYASFRSRCGSCSWSSTRSCDEEHIGCHAVGVIEPSGMRSILRHLQVLVCRAAASYPPRLPATRRRAGLDGWSAGGASTPGERRRSAGPGSRPRRRDCLSLMPRHFRRFVLKREPTGSPVASAQL